MIHPSVDDALAAIIAAVEEQIAPHVQDEYAASLCRTVGQMLRSVQARLKEEPAALAADNADLREVLSANLDRLPGDIRAQVSAALDARSARAAASLDELTAEALALRGALVRVIGAVTDSGDPVRKAARDYLRRQLERERPWMRDAFNGPRR
jgi:hypothetical protein